MYDAYNVYLKYYRDSSSDSDAGRGKSKKKDPPPPPPEDETMFPVCLSVSPLVVTMNRDFEMGPQREGVEMFKNAITDKHKFERHAPLIAARTNGTGPAAIGPSWNYESYYEAGNFITGGTATELPEGIPLQMPYYVPNPNCQNKCPGHIKMEVFCTHIDTPMTFDNSQFNYQLQIVIKMRNRDNSFHPNAGVTVWGSPPITTAKEMHFDAEFDMPFADHMWQQYTKGEIRPLKFDLSFRWVTTRKDIGTLYDEGNFPYCIRDTPINNNYYVPQGGVWNSAGFTWLIKEVVTSMPRGYCFEVIRSRNYEDLGLKVLSNDTTTQIARQSFSYRGRAGGFPRENNARLDGTYPTKMNSGFTESIYGSDSTGTLVDGFWYVGRYADIFPENAEYKVGLIINQLTRINQQSNRLIGLRLTSGLQPATSSDFKTEEDVKTNKPIGFFDTGSPNNEAAVWLNSHSTIRDHDEINVVPDAHIYIPTTSAYLVRFKRGTANDQPLGNLS